MPRISVIMPAYNAQQYIAEAIDSILGQTFSDFELIVLNDCSRDATGEIVRSYSDSRLVYVENEENLGVAGTLNRGLALASGEYIARMDSDDISLPQRFAQQVAFLDANPQVIACGSNAILFGDTQGKTEMPTDDRSIRLRMALTNPFVHPSMMLRKSALEGIGYDCTFEGREDYRMWMVLSQRGELQNLPQPLLQYRLHGGQVTQQKDDAKAQKHFRLKKTYYEQLDVGLTAKMQEALCYGAFYGKVRDEAMAEQLRLGLWQIARHYGCKKLPQEYASMLLGALRPLPRKTRMRLSAGLSLRMRLSLVR